MLGQKRRKKRNKKTACLFFYKALKGTSLKFIASQSELGLEGKKSTTKDGQNGPTKRGNMGLFFPQRIKKGNRIFQSVGTPFRLF